MRASPLSSSSVIRCFAVALVVAAIPASAAAANTQGDPAAVNKVTTLNKKALDAYNKKDYEAARSLLKEALQVCASAGLDQHPITARTHIHFGAVAIVGYKQREVGIKQFRKALAIEPDIKLTRSIVTPDLQDAFDEAVQAESGGGGGGAAAAGGGGEDEEGAPAQQADEGDEGEEKPVARRSRPPPRRRHGGDGDEDDDEDEKGAGGGQTGSFFLGFAVGTGFGLASGSGTLNPGLHKLSSAGFALAQAGQIAPEIGFFVSRDLLLSASLRFQYVTGLNGEPGLGCGSDNFCTPGNTGVAGFAKATWLLSAAPFRFNAGAQIGGGAIRHAVVFNDSMCRASATSTTNQKCVDTLDGGPFLVGPTVGFFYELGDMVDLIVAVNSALGVPNFTFNFDVQAGLGFRM